MVAIRKKSKSFLFDMAKFLAGTIRLNIRIWLKFLQQLCPGRLAKEDRDNVIHYKSKAIVIDTQPHSFAHIQCGQKFKI